MLLCELQCVCLGGSGWQRTQTKAVGKKIHNTASEHFAKLPAV